MQINSSTVIQVISIQFPLLYSSTGFHCVVQVNRISLLYRSTGFHCYTCQQFHSYTGQYHFIVVQVNSILLLYRLTAFHCTAGQLHSTVIQATSIPLSYSQQNSTVIQANSIPLSYRSITFHCYKGQHFIAIQVNNVP